MSEEILQARENLMKSMQTFLKKFNRISFRETPKVLSQAWDKFFEIQHAQPEDTHKLLCKLLEYLQIINKELAEYINSSSWNRLSFFNDDNEHSIQYKEYLENSSNAIAPVLPTEEPNNSLSMKDEHLSTIPETKSDEVIKSSIENLVPIPSEFEDFSDIESECDVPVCDDFMTFSIPLFDSGNDFSSSDDESFSIEDVPKENFKIYSNPLSDNEIISSKIDTHHFNFESDLIESLLNQDISTISYPKIDSFLDEFSEICLIEELLYDNSSPRPPKEYNSEISNATIEAFSPSHIPIEDSDSHVEDIDLFLAMDDLMPPSIENEDYDSEGDIQPDTGVLTTQVVKGISEHYVLMPNILPTQPTLCPNIDTLLSFSSKNEDKVFKPGILSYLLISHWDKTTFDFSENPMMITPDLEASRARGFVHRPLELQSFAYGNPISLILLI
nr:hypothetical protein [Tanacetum cinerariifolium]